MISSGREQDLGVSFRGLPRFPITSLANDLLFFPHEKRRAFGAISIFFFEIGLATVLEKDIQAIGFGEAHKRFGAITIVGRTSIRW